MADSRRSGDEIYPWLLNGENRPNAVIGAGRSTFSISRVVYFVGCVGLLDQ
jgi:hypothetical protein